MLFKKVNILLLLCLFSIKSFAVYKLWTYDNGGSRYPSDIILQKTLIVDFVSDKGDAVTLFGNTIKPLVGHNIYQFDNYTHEINIASNDTIYSVSCESNNYENQVFTRSDKTYSTGYSLEDLYFNNISQVQAFVATHADNKYVYLTQVFYVPKGTPYIMKVYNINSDIYGISRLRGAYLNSITIGNQDFKQDCYNQYQTDLDNISKNLLKKDGEYGQIISLKNEKSNLYILHQEDKDQMFYQIPKNGKNVISMVSCYLDLNNISFKHIECKEELSNYVPPVTSNITSITNNKSKYTVAYNLLGQRVNINTPGIVIINGKKIFNKK